MRLIVFLSLKSRLMDLLGPVTRVKKKKQKNLSGCGPASARTAVATRRKNDHFT